MCITERISICAVCACVPLCDFLCFCLSERARVFVKCVFHHTIYAPLCNDIYSLKVNHLTTIMKTVEYTKICTGNTFAVNTGLSKKSENSYLNCR